MTAIQPTTVAETQIPRTGWIDATRGLAISLVVLGHVIQFGSHENFDFFLHPVFLTIYSFHMPLFIFISGYLSANSFQKRGLTATFEQRAKSLLVPLLVWSFVGMFIIEMLKQVKNRSFDGIALLQTASQVFIHPDSKLWFLWVLFLANIAVALSFKVFQKRANLALGATLVLFAAVPGFHFLSYVQLKWLIPFFVLGIVVSRYKNLLAGREGRYLLAATVGFIALLMFWSKSDSVYVSGMSLLPTGLVSTILSWIYRYSIAILGIALVVLLVRLLAKRYQLRLLQGLGKASLGIYCIQTFIMIGVAQAPAPSDDPIVYNLIYVPLVTAAVLFGSYALTVLVLARFRLTSTLLLGRSQPRESLKKVDSAL